jgi:hypothetical protein
MARAPKCRLLSAQMLAVGDQVHRGLPACVTPVPHVERRSERVVSVSLEVVSPIESGLDVGTQNTFSTSVFLCETPHHKLIQVRRDQIRIVATRWPRRARSPERILVLRNWFNGHGVISFIRAQTVWTCVRGRGNATLVGVTHGAQPADLESVSRQPNSADAITELG